MTPSWPNASLILAAHGSHQHPEAAELIQGHAASIRDRKLFAEVKAGFWHGTPELSKVLSILHQSTAYVVPVFKSDGHFTRVIIPQEMGLEGSTTSQTDADGPDTVHLCRPVGSHPGIPKLVNALAADACAEFGVIASEANILIVGHGGGANSGSKIATDRVVKTLIDSSIFGSVNALFLEQDPLLDHWRQMGAPKNVIVVPFLIGGGRHEAEISARMSENRADRLFITRPVGELSNISRIIVDQVAAHPASSVSTYFDDN